MHKDIVARMARSKNKKVGTSIRLYVFLTILKENGPLSQDQAAKLMGISTREMFKYILTWRCRGCDYFDIVYQKNIVDGRFDYETVYRLNLEK